MKTMLMVMMMNDGDGKQTHMAPLGEPTKGSGGTGCPTCTDCKNPKARLVGGNYTSVTPNQGTQTCRHTDVHPGWEAEGTYMQLQTDTHPECAA